MLAAHSCYGDRDFLLGTGEVLTPERRISNFSSIEFCFFRCFIHLLAGDSCAEQHAELRRDIQRVQPWPALVREGKSAYFLRPASAHPLSVVGFLRLRGTTRLRTRHTHARPAALPHSGDGFPRTSTSWVRSDARASEFASIALRRLISSALPLPGRFTYPFSVSQRPSANIPWPVMKVCLSEILRASRRTVASRTIDSLKHAARLPPQELNIGGNVCNQTASFVNTSCLNPPESVRAPRLIA